MEERQYEGMTLETVFNFLRHPYRLMRWIKQYRVDSQSNDGITKRKIAQKTNQLLEEANWRNLSG